MKSGNLNFLEPSGPLQACKWTDLIEGQGATLKFLIPHIRWHARNSLLSLLNSPGNLEATEFLLQICRCDLSFTELCSKCRNGFMFLHFCSILRRKQRSETKLRYLIILWSRVLLEKLTVCRLVKKIPTFYGTRRFITAFTTARHLSLSWAR